MSRSGKISAISYWLGAQNRSRRSSRSNGKVRNQPLAVECRLLQLLSDGVTIALLLSLHPPLEIAMGGPSPDAPPSEKPAQDRLDSWKEIAAYLNRDVTTVQRWEKREGMPVHRHLHDRMGRSNASRSELDAWVRSRNLETVQNGDNIPSSASFLRHQRLARQCRRPLQDECSSCRS